MRLGCVVDSFAVGGDVVDIGGVPNWCRYQILQVVASRNLHRKRLVYSHSGCVA